MKKITNQMVESSYEVGKQIFSKQLTLKEGIKILTNIGMNKNSAVDCVFR